MTLIEYDFTDYLSRSDLLAAGWDFQAESAAGTPRDTESGNATYGASGMTFPVAPGAMWSENSVDEIFHDLAPGWTSVTIRLNWFGAYINARHAGLVIYQDDDNFVMAARRQAGDFIGYWSVAGTVNWGSPISGSEATGFWLRVERTGDDYTMRSSFDGSTWSTIGTRTQTLTSPRLGIWVGDNNGANDNTATILSATVDVPGNTYEISGVAQIISGASGEPTAILGIEGSSDVVSAAVGTFGAVFDISGSASIISAASGSFQIYSEEPIDTSSAFPLIEKVARAFIKARYPAIGSRVGGDAQYVLGQEPYIQVQQMPGGGATQLEGEWAVDIAVFDDNFVRAAEMANELEDLFLRTRGARHEGMIIDKISQNQTPSKRPTPDKRIFEVGTIYVFEARRRS